MTEEYNIEDIIIRYLQQDIKEDEMRFLDVWLDESADNKRYFFQLKNISDLSRYAKPVGEEEKENSWQRMQVKMRNQSEQAAPVQVPVHKNKVYGSFMKYAAAILLLVCAATGGGLFERYKMLAALEEEVPVFNEIRVEKGGRASTLFLADGSKVVLNAATTLKYPTSFKSGKREVFLDGEAFFEVAKDKEKPFVVRLKKQNITVLGTSFNVKAYGNTSYSVTTLLSGRVSLEAFNDKGETMSNMLLKPNQKALSDNQTGSVALYDVDASMANSWMRGEYKFKDEVLSSIIKSLENYYDVKIHLENPDWGHIKYTGTFSLSQDVRDALDIINYDKHFVFRQTEKDIYIKKK